MTDLLQEFERECADAGISPPDALKAGGLHPTNWWRWKSDKVSPSLKNFGRAKEGLDQLKAQQPATQ